MIDTRIDAYGRELGTNPHHAGRHRYASRPRVRMAHQRDRDILQGGGEGTQGDERDTRKEAGGGSTTLDESGITVRLEGGPMIRLLHRVQEVARHYLGLEWIQEARDIAEKARDQREEDKARANKDPHDMAQWLQDPKDYRRPKPGDKQ